MNTFPAAVCPRMATKETTLLPIIKVESDANYTKVRRVSTRAREKFELAFSTITETEFATLKAFFIANQGLPFIFVHPNSAISYTCVFNQSELKKTYFSKLLVSTQMVLEEV